MKQLDEQVNISLSHGAELPNSVLATTNLSKLIQQAAAKNTGITYYSDKKPKREFDFQSYADLLTQAQCILKSLRDRGLQPQDKVILQLQNPRYFFASLWGCFLGGFVPIPLGVDPPSPSLTDRSSILDRAWELCDSPLIISDREIKGLAWLQVEDLLDNEPDNQWHCGKLDDLALLLFTSGSTGKPKGVMLSARNLIASIYGMAQVNQLTGQDISLNWMPLEHVASLAMFHLTQVYLGCQQIHVKSELILQNPLQWLDLIDKHRVTATWSPNFAYNLVNERLENTAQRHWDLSCLRWVGNGAEAVVGKTTQRFLKLLVPCGLSPNALSPGYGMSETTSGIAHSNNFYLNLNREFVEVGAPIPGVSLRIVNQAQQILPEGEVGLLQVKGQTVSAGYYQQPELNQELFTADGWLNTGDLGFLNSGRLTVTGRQKDVIIINGVNYYNHDIETVVEAIASVTVSYTAACGVKDSNQQEQIAIFFNTQESEDCLSELINQIRKNVFTQIGVAAAYIIPVEKEIIPKTAIGKIQRLQLSQRFAAGEFERRITEIAELFNQRNLSQQELPGNAIEQRLVEVWQEVLNLPTVSVKDNFFELGGNSLLLMQVLSKLAEYNHLSAVMLFQYPTISALSNYLNCDRESIAVQQGKRKGELRRKATGNKDVAIIGMSCRFPGANNLEEFWDNLCNGVESSWFFLILDEGVAAELLNHPDYVKASPILEDIESFDADFWGYSPKEAQLLDPQQRLFLECAWSSLEDAGYDCLTYEGDISLYGGAASNTYLLNNLYPNRHLVDEQDSMAIINLSSMGGFQVTTANDKDYLTTRTSYKLNLTGSSVNVQTACSTSLVAVHLACQSLINLECDLALAGGVSVHSPQKMGYLYQEGMILSPDGHCRAFDAEAAGTIFGSGAGMVVLKLLERAIADGDRIYGVIKGSAVNNDGGIKVGYLAPNVDGQTRVIAEALAFANIPPQSVSYIEAHGTGTKLGDPIEITALTQAYQNDRQNTGYCAVGSVKTNVGHLQMASGIVGLIKTTLCLYHQEIAPSLHFKQPNPQIDFPNSPFYINTQLQPWESTNYPRRAGVNSLGIGGTNAHVILEEFVAKKAVEEQQLPAYLLTLSAKTPAALQELVKSDRDYLCKHQDIRLPDICFTSNIGRHHFDYRVGIVASNKLELVDKLNQISTGELVRQNNKLAFLFTGQGSQYVGMGQQLYKIQPVFQENCDRCFEILQLYLDLVNVRMNGGLFLQDEYLNQTEYTQPLLFTIEYSLAKLWLSWGIKPDVVMGHSIGEYVAATVAGVFSLEDALKLVAIRGKLMQSLPKNGTMLAVFCSQAEVNFNLAENISIASDNGTHLVLSGLQSEIDNIAQKLELRGIKTQLLNVSHAFHSPLMQPIIAEFKTVAQTINYSLPQIPIVSNLTGELADTGDLGFLNSGRLTVTGRQKDVIIINGVNYYNHDIETVVEAIASVTVSYTAACGVKDSNQQEQIAIFFNTQESEDCLSELINQIRKNVFTQIGVAAAYIIPVEKEIIPKTAIGKIQRLQLSQRFAAGEFERRITEIAELFNQRNLSQQELPGNAIEQRLVEVWQEVLNLPTVSVKDNFFELGGNSLLLMQVLSKLAEYNHLSAVMLFQYPTISALSNYLNCDRESIAVQQGKRKGELRRKATGNKDVAIIGMSCRFPGANNLEEFWDNLCNGVESISFFDDAEILDAGVAAELLNHPHYVKASPILEDIESFDADFWGYSPKEAQLLDPQQRLFLECAWSSLEDAGYDCLTYEGDISLYGGAASNTYLLNNLYPNRHLVDEQDSMAIINLSSMGGFQVTTANDKDYLTTRTSYKLNLTGSSVNVQTACSTSLVTVHLACQSLINLECDLALAGGVSVHSPQKMGYLYQEGMILSPDGHCRAFDAEAAGTIFGSGAGMVVLKLLERAIADGDRIYGVIKGSAVNNDGGTKVGYLAPNVDGQTRVIAEALAFANIPPQSVSYIEAHGTGTKLGDPIEITALTQAYQNDRQNTGYCAVGSVKTNVGHLQMASGIVGLIKTTLCLYHQEIAPSLHFKQPNPQIDFPNSPFYINTQLQPWESTNYPRRAGVNSLGIGGTNAHVILEEFVTKKAVDEQQLPAYLLTLSAKTPAALQELVKSDRDYLCKHQDIRLPDICFTSNIGRHHFDYRVGIVASNKLELVDKLNQISTGELVRQNNKLAFLFTGQGSQYVGMGQQLYKIQPVFQENCDRCFEILQLYLDLVNVRMNGGLFLQDEYLNQTEYTQPLLFTIEYSLAKLWLSWGIKPDVVMGHSIGEYVAATVAGVFSLEDALKLVAIRGKLMQSLPKNGTMLAVFCSQAEVNFNLAENISIASDNGTHLVLSGLQSEIDNIAQKLELRGIKTQLLNVSHAFHSPLMQPIIAEFKTVAQTINYSLNTIYILHY